MPVSGNNYDISLFPNSEITAPIVGPIAVPGVINITADLGLQAFTATQPDASATIVQGLNRPVTVINKRTNHELTISIIKDARSRDRRLEIYALYVASVETSDFLFPVIRVKNLITQEQRIFRNNTLVKFPDDSISDDLTVLEYTFISESFENA